MKSGIVFDLDHTLYEDPPNMLQIWMDASYAAGQVMGLNLSRTESDSDMLEGVRHYGSGPKYFSIKYGIDTQIFNTHMLSFVDLKIIDSCPTTQSRLLAYPDFEMGVLTSGVRAWAIPVLTHLGLASIFHPHHIVTMEDTKGHFKSTHRYPFELISDRMEMKPNQLIMVEDNPVNLKIAYDLGMTTILVTHGSRPNEKPPHIDFIVDKAYHVFDLIDQGAIKCLCKTAA